MHFLLSKGLYINSICNIVYRNNLSILFFYVKLVSPEQSSAFFPHMLYFMKTPSLIILIHHLHNIRESMLSSADLNFNCWNLCYSVAALDAEFI